MLDRLVQVEMDTAEFGLDDEVSSSRQVLYVVESVHVGKMYLFDLFQNGLIFTALATGLVCLGHIAFCLPTTCRNWPSLFTVILTGFVHIFSCITVLDMSKEASFNQFPFPGNDTCTDYSLTSTLANCIIFAVIVAKVIKHSTETRLSACLQSLAVTVSMVTGFVLMMRRNAEHPLDLQQKEFMSIGQENNDHVEIFWTVCLKDIRANTYNLLCEYVLIYIPVVIVMLKAWYKLASKHTARSYMKIVVLDEECRTDDGCSSVSCMCTKLNSALLASVLYAGLILFVARPVMIAYGLMTTGTMRDILPSLLQTVIFCFICSEMLMCMYRSRSYRSPKAKIVLHV